MRRIYQGMYPMRSQTEARRYVLLHFTSVTPYQAIDKLNKTFEGDVEEEAEIAKAHLADAVSLLLMACLSLAQKIGKGEYPSSHKEMVSNAIKTLHLTLDFNRLDTDVRI